jgi:hypothetical protein
MSREAVVSVMLMTLDIEWRRSDGYFVEAMDELYRLIQLATR